MSSSSDINQAIQPFLAAQTSTVNLTSGVASSRVAFTFPPAGGDGTGVNAQNYKQFQIFNSGAQPTFVNFGGVAVAALAPAGAAPGDYPVAAGATVVVTVIGNPTNVACISLIAGGVVFVTPGNGT